MDTKALAQMSTQEKGDLASVLAKAMDTRRFDIAVNDEEDEEDWSDEEAQETTYVPNANDD